MGGSIKKEGRSVYIYNKCMQVLSEHGDKIDVVIILDIMHCSCGAYSPDVCMCEMCMSFWGGGDCEFNSLMASFRLSWRSTQMCGKFR